MVGGRHNRQGLLPETHMIYQRGGLHVCPRHTKCPSTLVHNVLELFNHNLGCTLPHRLIQHTPNCQRCTPLPLPGPLPFSFHNKLPSSWHWEIEMSASGSAMNGDWCYAMLQDEILRYGVNWNGINHRWIWHFLNVFLDKYMSWTCNFVP